MPIVSVCLPPKDAYFKIVEKGEQAANAPTIKVFHQAFVGGCYIGFGGLLSMVIGGSRCAHMITNSRRNSPPLSQRMIITGLASVE